MPTSSCSWLSSDDLAEANYVADGADEAEESQSSSVIEAVQRDQVQRGPGPGP